jgi:hypothetical protein
VETVEQGSNIVFLQGGLSKQDWLEPICAYKDQRRGSYEDTMERKAGFDRVYGTTNNGLATFMGLPAGAPTQFFDVWQSLEPGRLLLETPAYIDGYQARIKQAAQDGSRKIDSVRFLLRSWKKAGNPLNAADMLLPRLVCRQPAPGPPDGLPADRCCTCHTAAPGTHLFDSVFISYTLKDEAAHKFALDLDAALKRKKMRCFLGERELTAGVVWEPAIRELASCSKVFVPVLSKTYLERPWCLAELHLAMNQRAEGAVSVPILIGGTGLSKSELINPQTQTAWIDRWERQALDVQQKAGVRKTPNRCADFKKLLESGLDEVWPTAGAETVAKILGKFGVLGKP